MNNANNAFAALTSLFTGKGGATRFAFFLLFVGATYCYTVDGGASLKFTTKSGSSFTMDPGTISTLRKATEKAIENDQRTDPADKDAPATAQPESK
jgi:hypothetical protein